MRVLRLKCHSCESTHAALPGDVVPYCIYSYSFMLQILNEHFIYNHSVLTLADRFCAGTTLLGLGTAFLMKKEFPFRSFIRTLIILPYFAPVISVVFGWQFIFEPVNGIFNHVFTYEQAFSGVIDQGLAAAAFVQLIFVGISILYSIIY